MSAFFAVVLTTALAAGESVSAELPATLKAARALAEQLRYEEAVVEFQRYVNLPERPAKERSAALFDLGFIHLVLGDDVNARQRAMEALELDEDLKLSPNAPARQSEFLNQQRREFRSRAKLVLEARQNDDGPTLVRVRLFDPSERVRRVLLRHALAPEGPYLSTDMRCEGWVCSGTVPQPRGATTFNAWYYVEALDEGRQSVARVGSAEQAQVLAVSGRVAWYQSPWVWGIGGAAVVAVTAVVFLLAPPAPK